MENALPNQQPKNVDCSFTETNKIDHLGSDSGQLAPVYYIRGNAAFRMPISGTEIVGELPIFQFATCNGDSRMLVEINDDEFVQRGQQTSLVYFDGKTQELVFVGDQYPPFGTYEVIVKALVRRAGVPGFYISSQFTLTVYVVDQVPDGLNSFQ